MTTAIDQSLQEWYKNRERELIEKNLGTAWAYNTASPWNRFIDEFTQLMDNTINERNTHIKNWELEHGERELPDDPLNLEDTREPESLEEMFCDSCGQLNFSLHGFGEATYCASCFKENGFQTQNQLQQFDNPASSVENERCEYALVGCGADKQAGVVSAKQKYSSSYFEKKKQFSEELCGSWWILSAKYGVLNPDKEIDDYDVSIEHVDANGWIKRVSAYLENETDVGEEDRLWVLVGQDYLEAENSQGRSFRDWLDGWGPEIRYPFEFTSGIGEQNRYLDRCVGRGRAVMPYRFEEFTKKQKTFADF